MIFSSILFLWIFLPVTVVGYYICRLKCRNAFLACASLVFYTWGEPVYIWVMLLSIFGNWLSGIWMERARRKKYVLAINIIFNLSLLGFFKYCSLFINSIGEIIQGNAFQEVDIHLPIGISFFTFQAMSYIIDLYREKYKAQHSLLNIMLYISFFPQLIAGPIVRYSDVVEQLAGRTATIEKFGNGLKRFIYGLGKKVILANMLAQVADAVVALDMVYIDWKLAWVGAICYTLTIYFDFSGYSDMAIGLGMIFGFEFPENFRLPYQSISITEFWRRWHISLGTWFREYLYIPLGGNRRGSRRTYINLAIVFALTGFWHGAGWNFLFWGIYYAFFIIIERMGLKNVLERHKIIGQIYTLGIVNFGWVFFNNNSIKRGLAHVMRMIMPWRYAYSAYSVREFLDNKSLLIMIVSVCGCGLIQCGMDKLNIRHLLKNSVIEMFFCITILILSFMFLANDVYNPFIYFRF